MTIEEIAKKWSKDVDFECKGPAKQAYIEGYRAALTSLLEELPDTFDEYGMRKGSERIKEETISLIQTKLK